LKVVGGQQMAGRPAEMPITSTRACIQTARRPELIGRGHEFGHCEVHIAPDTSFA
jgi:hypothetical protein